MAVFDTHKVFERLTGAGFSKEMAEALIDAVGDSRETSATRADIADMATKADLRELESRVTATLERRLNILFPQLALLQVAVGGLIVAALKLLP